MMFVLLPSFCTDSSLCTDQICPFLLHLTHRVFSSATYTIPALQFTASSTGSERKQKRVKKCQAEQVEGPEHGMLGKEQVHKQHDLPEPAGFVGLQFFLVGFLAGVWFFWGLFFCQCFPFSHHTRSVSILPAPKADPLSPHNPLQPFRENVFVSAELQLILFLVAVQCCVLADNTPMVYTVAQQHLTLIKEIFPVSCSASKMGYKKLGGTRDRIPGPNQPKRYSVPQHFIPRI